MERAHCNVISELFRVLVFAGLVGNTAAGLACALAGSLALAAAALDGALCHITGIQCHDMLHDDVLSEKYSIAALVVKNAKASVCISCRPA